MEIRATLKFEVQEFNPTRYRIVGHNGLGIFFASSPSEAVTKLKEFIKNQGFEVDSIAWK